MRILQVSFVGKISHKNQQGDISLFFTTPENVKVYGFFSSCARAGHLIWSYSNLICFHWYGTNRDRVGTLVVSCVRLSDCVCRLVSFILKAIIISGALLVLRAIDMAW